MSEALGPERTRAFEVTHRSFTLPDLTRVRRVATVTGPVESDTSTTFFDTDDLRLATRQVTVGRTFTGDGAGWTLQMDGTRGATSRVQTEAGAVSDDVPEELTDLVRASVRGKELGPVASVRTVRVERRLLDGDGRELARVAEDQVHGQRYSAGTIELSYWREVDVELLGGDVALLEDLTTSLDDAGLVPMASSKVHRALGHASRPVDEEHEHRAEGTAASVVRELLRDEVSALVAQDWALRQGGPDAADDMRLACRRLRADLGTWAPLLDDDGTDRVRRELGWLSGLLGRVRDAELLDERLVGTIRRLPSDMVVGPVLERVEAEVHDRGRAATTRLDAALGGARYFELLEELERLVADPPFTEMARGPADEVLSARAARAVARLEEALAPLDQPLAADRLEEQLHRVRKAAKRAAYALEPIHGEVGQPARVIADRLADLLDALAEHKRTVVSRHALRDIGASAHVAGESAFTYGILAGIERDRGEAAMLHLGTARAALAGASLSLPRGPDRDPSPSGTATA